MKLSARHVAELCEELSALLAGWTVKDVQGLPPRDVLVVLEPPTGAPTGGPPVLRLRLSASPDAPRLHLQHGRVQRHDGPQGPFFQRLQKELIGAEVRGVSPVRGDRIALVELRSDEGRRAVLLELFGRRANMALLAPRDVVLDVLVPPPAKAKDAARMQAGEPWGAPPGAVGQPDGDPLEASLPDPSGPPPGRDPTISDVRPFGRAPLSWRVECSLGELASEARDADLRRGLRQRVKRKLARNAALIAGLEQKAEAAGEIERVRQDGELLKAALGQLERGLDGIELDDWFTDGTPKRRIELDPRRSPQENVERVFARVRKLERAASTVADERARAEERGAALEALLARVEDEANEPEALEKEALAAGLVDPRQEADARKRKAPAPRKPFKTYTSGRGFEIRVGRTARDNDTLTLRHARGNDLWLHTADVPGSHVILRRERNQEPNHEDILDAAILAAHFSPAKGKDRVPVHVVPRKHVSKPKGAKAGLVTLSGGKIVTVRLDEERLERLLRREVQPQADERS